MGFVIWLGLSLIPAAVAKGKGRSFVGWFIISLLISPLLSLIIVALLKSVREDPKTVSTANYSTTNVTVALPNLLQPEQKIQPTTVVTAQPMAGGIIEQEGWYKLLAKDELPSDPVADAQIGGAVYLQTGKRLRPGDRVARIMDEGTNGPPEASDIIFARYENMEDSTLKIRYRDRKQYTGQERAVIEWESKRRGHDQT